MSGMVERVARAIIENEWGEHTYLHVSNGARRKATRQARAAIAAMRNPTAAMAEAYDTMGEWDMAPSYPTATHAMHAMIDAAMEETP